MIRIPGRIPIAIYPSFWIVVFLLGYLMSQSLVGMFFCAAVIVVSLLVHEFGHALTALAFGQNPRIELMPFGGITFHEGRSLSIWKQCLIVFDGPLSGFLLLGVAYFAEMLWNPGGLWGEILLVTQWINLVWTALNLLPILPLYGGQLMRLFFEAFSGAKGLRYALFTSMLVGIIASLVAFLFQNFLLGALFFLLAFQSLDGFRKSRLMNEGDRKEALKRLLEQGEIAMHEGRKEAAVLAFEQLREEAKGGMLYLVASQELAFLRDEEGNQSQVYALLRPLARDLSGGALVLLHKAAFEMGDYALTDSLAARAFQELPLVETAVRSACAAAALSKIDPALGWLHTALQEGLMNLHEIVAQPHFDTLRSDPHLQHFLDHHKPKA
jgi:stage IV sporulation protein FB